MRPNMEKAVHEFHDLKDKTVHQMEHARDVAFDAGRDAAKRLDREAHRNPWIFIGVTAFLTAVIGFLLGHKISRRD